MKRQIVVDIRELTRLDLVVHTIQRFRALALELELPVLPERARGERASVASVLHQYGIVYRAPCDIRSSGLPSGSVDCITSTSTFEHLPESDIPQVMRECCRLLTSDGVLSNWIDYKDHYSYFDASIGPFNFLRYSERAWSRYSPALHYQNRLRHLDFVRFFDEAGLVIVEEERIDGSADDVAAIDDLGLAERFTRYSHTDLAVRDGRLVAKRKS